VLTGTSLGEEGVEGVVTSTNSLIRRHLSIRLNTVFQAEKLPAGVTYLDTSLTNMDTDSFTHCKGRKTDQSGSERGKKETKNIFKTNWL
jgi:hypothetical protein